MRVNYLYIKLFNNKIHPIPMFTFEGLKIETHPDVYDPAEDTFLLLDSIDVEQGLSVFEIGTGCGIIAIYCASKGANVVCSDINPYAVELARKNYEMNKHLIPGRFEVRLGDLFSVLKGHEIFDLIIFNPPYLPTKKDQLVGGFFDKAVDGGINGLTTIERFIKDVRKYLKRDGRAIFICSSLSNIKRIEKMIGISSLSYSIVNEKRFNDETLYVFLLKKF